MTARARLTSTLAVAAIALLALAAPALARWRPPVVMFEAGCKHDCMTFGPGMDMHGMDMGDMPGMSGAMKALMDEYADPGMATAAQRHRAWRLLAQVHRATHKVFPNLQAARRLGYVRGSAMDYIHDEGPHQATPFIHYDLHRAFYDGHTLDPMHPESLVYLRRRNRPPRLVGFMFRQSSLATPPNPLGLLLRWHVHARCDATATRSPYQFRTDKQHCASGLAHYGPTTMVHVWLTTGLQSAYAQDAPARQLGVSIRDAR